MTADLNKVPLLARREIEARLAGPLVASLAPACGRDAVMAALKAAIEDLARAAGAAMAEESGDNSMAAMDTVLTMWGQDRALEVRTLGHSNTHYHFDVVGCRYAEMYRELGLAELGLIMSCGRDFAFFQGFNPKIELKRTKTIMEGADCCDFRFRLREDG